MSHTSRPTLWLNCMSKVFVRAWLKRHKMWSGKKIITSQRVRDSRAQSVGSRTSYDLWAMRGLGRYAADMWRSHDWKIEVVENELQLWSSVGLIFLLISRLTVRESELWPSASVFVFFVFFFPSACMRSKETERKSGTGRRMKADGSARHRWDATLTKGQGW